MWVSEGGARRARGGRGKSKHAFADLFEFLVVFHLGGSLWAAGDRRMGIVEGRSSKSRRRLAMARRCWLLGRERVVLRGGGQRGAAKDQDNKGQGREGAGGRRERETVGWLDDLRLGIWRWSLGTGHWGFVLRLVGEGVVGCRVAGRDGNQY